MIGPPKARQVKLRSSPERFGYEWSRYASILPQYEEQFRRWLPFYAPKDWHGKRFLDVGCGMGRNSFWPLRYGASGGVGIDLDERSLDAARSNLAQYATMSVRKLSVYDIDYRQEFDITFSIGVIHHLEHPEAALAAMHEATKPGGQLAIWVYGRENLGCIVGILDPMRKLLFSRLPVAWVHALSLIPTAMLWVALRCGLDQIEYFRLVRSFSFSHLRSIVFDQMLPEIANYWTRSEVERLMRNTGLEDIELVSVNEMSWAARGRRPARQTAPDRVGHTGV